MESLIGRDISKYHLLEQLGEGGMAVVYKAIDTSLERFVAIKLIRKETIAEYYYAQMLQRFEREAKVLASLDHPNIVTIFDYGQYQGSPYLVEKFIPGGALRLAGRQMPVWQASGLLSPVARALEYAHRRGVIHRDVKPSNILIGENGDPQLSDFGIAKILEAGSLRAADTFTTSTGMQIGTPQYMAPEQWQGKPSTHSDIYALGVVLYEMVTGRPPYTADTPASLMIQQATQPLPRPSQFVPELPKPVEELILKALALKVEERYASMGEFAAALEQLAYGESSRSPDLERARRLASATTWFASAQGAASEKEPPPSGGGKILPVEQEPEPGQAAGQGQTDQPGRKRLVRPIWLAGGGAGLAGLVLLAIWLSSSGFWPVIRSQAGTATFTSSPAVPSSTWTITPPANTPTKTAAPTVTPSATVTPQPSPTSTLTLTPTSRPTAVLKPTATPTRVKRPKGPTAVPP